MPGIRRASAPELRTSPRRGLPLESLPPADWPDARRPPAAMLDCLVEAVRHAATPTEERFYVAPDGPITAESVTSFLDKYKEGGLERKQLG